MIEPESGRKLRILLVEDSEHDRLAFKRTIDRSGAGYEVTYLDNAEAALDLLAQDRSGFDLVISDFMLPGLSGLDLCRRLLEKNFQAPLMILTGSGNEHLAVEALKAGVYDYVVKDPNNGYLDLLPVVLADTVKKHNERLARIRAEEEKERLIEQLQAALKEVKKLSGLLPICANCKKIRDDSGYWKQIEAYIRDHSEAEFSHSICPECARELYPELYKNK